MLATTWAQYRANHPEIAASWGEQNGREVNCTCAKCDPDQERPRPDIFADEGEYRPYPDGMIIGEQDKGQVWPVLEVERAAYVTGDLPIISAA